ncbi:CCAAT/enhancer-binding protein homolog 2 isoform X2 [Polyergus mexicanus]|uniref:CCAAT/enhancer-binding protein homolog 2 isoform X2 n=1 Tax=Polyergus mexicanus TaxID=615972 RepID=UPI0038B5C922
MMSVDFYERPSSPSSSLLFAIYASRLNPVRGFQVEVAHESVRAGFLTTTSRSYWMAPKNKENNAKRKKQVEDEGDEDYRKRRDRNNQAVKRSRVKSKLRTQQTLERVNQLKTENELLEEKIKMLTKELGFLKDLFLAHAAEDKSTVDGLKTTTAEL